MSGSNRTRAISFVPAPDNDDERCPGSGIVTSPTLLLSRPPPISLRGDKQVMELDFNGLGTGPCRVVRLSPVAIWFVPKPGEHYPTHAPVQLTLRANGRTVRWLWGRVGAVGTETEDGTLCIALLDATGEAALKIVALLRELNVASSPAPHGVLETTSDPRRIAATVRAFASVENRGRLRVVGDELPLRVHGIGEDGFVRWNGSAEWGKGPYAIDLAGRGATYRLYVASVQPEGRHCMTPLPDCIERIGRRRSASSPLAGIEVQFPHPIWPRRRSIRRELHDLSFGGLTFVTSLDDDLLFPRLMVPRVEVHGHAGDPILLHAEVRVVSQPWGDGMALAELGVVPCSTGDERKWARRVARSLYPALE